MKTVLRWMKQLRDWLMHDVWLYVVFGIALFVRLFRTGLNHINMDEMNLLFWSLRLARHGDWLWLSNNWIGWQGGSWFPFEYHSPMNNYLLAIPYLFFQDPLWIRAFVGGLAAVGVALMYLLVKRYFSLPAAVLAGLFLALSSTAVYWNRIAFNPPMGMPFVALWLYSGMLGYYENKRAWMMAHGVSMALAVQFHPAYAVLAPISLVLFVVNLWRYSDTRRMMLKWTASGIALGAVSLMPWVYGTLNPQQNAFLWESPYSADRQSLQAMSLNQLLDVAYESLGGRSIWYERQNARQSADWLPPTWLETLSVWLQPRLVLVGSALVLLGLMIWRRWTLFPLFILALVALLPIGLVFLLSRNSLLSWYFLATMFGALPVLGIWLASLWRWRVGRLVSLGLAGILLVSHSWLILAAWRWSDLDGFQQAMRLPIEDERAMLSRLTEKHEGVVLLDELMGRYGDNYTLQGYYWTVLSADLPVRVVSRYHQQGIPLSAFAPTQLISWATSTSIPRLLRNHPEGIERWGSANDGTSPVYQTALFSPQDIPELTLRPSSASKFTTGARIMGAYSETTPTAGEDWQITLVWTPERESPPARYQFSLRVLDATGNRIAQVDLHSLEPDLWRSGDIVLNLFSLPLPADAQLGEQVELELVMYEVDGRAQELVADDGSLQGQLMRLVWDR